MTPGHIRPLLPILPALLLLAACGAKKPDTGPEATVKRLIAAAQRQNTEAVYDLLGPRTQKRLQESAARASRLSGAKKPLEPHEMLSPSFRWNLQGDWKPKTFKVVRKTSTTAQVLVSGKKSRQRQVVDLVKVKGAWRIELPDPDGKPAAAGK